MAENHFMAEMYINLGSLYGRLTLWRDGFSQNQQNEQLYGEEHFMAERWSALWQRGTNFMDKILKDQAHTVHEGKTNFVTTNT